MLGGRIAGGISGSFDRGKHKYMIVDQLLLKFHFSTVLNNVNHLISILSCTGGTFLIEIILVSLFL